MSRIITILITILSCSATNADILLPSPPPRESPHPEWTWNGFDWETMEEKELKEKSKETPILPQPEQSAIIIGLMSSLVIIMLGRKYIRNIQPKFA